MRKRRKNFRDKISFLRIKNKCDFENKFFASLFVTKILIKHLYFNLRIIYRVLLFN